MKESITQTFSMTTIKVLSMLMIVFCAFSVQAQSRADLLTESFDGTSMPAGWSIVGAGQSNWSISPTSEAGGSPNEAMLAWEPQFNGISRLVTPSFDLTNVESVVVSFKHGLDNYSGSHTLGIATSSDGSNWHIGWSQSFSQSGAWTVNQVITTEDMGNNEVQFCIFYNGNSYKINYWYFD
ncbi:MAG: hypothetical protein PHR53_09035, partial [Bacteroidales bacterium]|nr:hypothetical protein [Bacteroidales bacterium]